MPAKKVTGGGICAAEVDAKLPKTYFVKRGHVQAAYGLTKDEMAVLVTTGVFRAEYPFGPGTRARFVRGQVMLLARKSETAA